MTLLLKILLLGILFPSDMLDADLYEDSLAQIGLTTEKFKIRSVCVQIKYTEFCVGILIVLEKLHLYLHLYFYYGTNRNVKTHFLVFIMQRHSTKASRISLKSVLKINSNTTIWISNIFALLNCVGTYVNVTRFLKNSQKQT